MTNSKQITEKIPEQMQTREQDPHTVRPAVDIYEDEKGISLYADIPGVSKHRLEIKLERNSLSIEGKAEINQAEKMLMYRADVDSIIYRRKFTLRGELDKENINASLNDGVLKIHIPKRAKYQPRKIEVIAA